MRDTGVQGSTCGSGQIYVEDLYGHLRRHTIHWSFLVALKRLGAEGY
jgi:hypothetical protein